jgi:hypothetical protein
MLEGFCLFVFPCFHLCLDFNTWAQWCWITMSTVQSLKREVDKAGKWLIQPFLIWKGKILSILALSSYFLISSTVIYEVVGKDPVVQCMTAIGHSGSFHKKAVPQGSVLSLLLNISYISGEWLMASSNLRV